MKNCLRITLEITIIYAVELFIGYLISLLHNDLNNFIANSMLVSFGFLSGSVYLLYKMRTGKTNKNYRLSASYDIGEYNIKQIFFLNKIMTNVLYKDIIIKNWSIKIPSTQLDIDNDYKKAQDFIKQLEKLK